MNSAAFTATLDAARQGEAELHAAALTAMREMDVTKLGAVQDMAEDFCGWLHAKGRQAMADGGEEAVETVRRLSTSFNKAARAMRLSMVLKHEVAGLRPLPHSRAPAAPGGGDGVAAPKPDHGSGTADHSLRDWVENADTEEFDAAAERGEAYFIALDEAFEADLATAPPDIQAEAKRQSIAVRLTTIAAAIPHPNLDKAIVDIELSQIWDMISPRHAAKPEIAGAAEDGGDNLIGRI